MKKKVKVLFIDDLFDLSLSLAHRCDLMNKFDCVIPFTNADEIDTLAKKYDDKTMIDPRELARASKKPIDFFETQIHTLEPDAIIASGFGCYILLDLLFHDVWTGPSIILTPTHIDQYNLEGDLDIDPVIYVTSNAGSCPSASMLVEKSGGVIIPRSDDSTFIGDVTKAIEAL